MEKSKLENRLLIFTSSVFDITDKISNKRGVSALSNHMIQNGINAALSYNEAQNCKSRQEFIDKLTLTLKELKSCLVCFNIIKNSELLELTEELDKQIQENNELISIFIKSIGTAIKNQKSEKEKNIEKEKEAEMQQE